MRGPVKQTLHIIYEAGYQVIALFSKIWNGYKGGSMHQTYSARTHMEAKDFPEWEETEEKIDRFFEIITFGRQKDHCKSARESEVDRARKTLRRNGDII